MPQYLKSDVINAIDYFISEKQMQYEGLTSSYRSKFDEWKKSGPKNIYMWARTLNADEMPKYSITLPHDLQPPLMDYQADQARRQVESARGYRMLIEARKATKAGYVVIDKDEFSYLAFAMRAYFAKRAEDDAKA